MRKPIPFGKYYLLERINVGGMAEVFRAKAYGVEGFERLVAVKRILPNIAEDRDFITMFIDEAKIAVQLNHANVAQIFDLGVVDGAYYIAMEHIHGRDLRAIFDRCRNFGDPMPIAQACFVLMKACEGLDYAHNKRDQSGRELNLVHRDVSPQNVLVSFEGEVKIIDFGIAKAAGKGAKTQAGILKGKFGYMSPEQVRGLPVDRRSDIFACGIVLYELLTGERLFVGESDFSTLEKVRNVEILPPSTYNRKIPDELERIVLKALAKDVEDRYQNAIDLHDELQAFVYTAGEFYSRKDLAGWMKKTFAKEIQEETAKLEQFRQIPAPQPQLQESPPRPVTLDERGGRRATLALPSVAPGKPPPPPPSGPQPLMAAPPVGGGDLEWDDDELETQIFDGQEEVIANAVAEANAPAVSGRAQASSTLMGAGQMSTPPPAPGGDQPNLSELVRSSSTWPEQGGPEATPAPMAVTQPPPTLANGSNNTPSPFDPEHDPSDVNAPPPVAEDPSAVVRLVQQGQQLAAGGTAEPIWDSGIPEELQQQRKSKTGFVVAIIAAVALLAGGAVGLGLYLGKDKDSGETKVAAGEGAAGQDTAATGGGAPPVAPGTGPGTEPAPAVATDMDTGFDVIVDPQGARIKLDGSDVGPAPRRVRNIAAGTHIIEIEAPGFFAKRQEVEVVAGKAEVVRVSLDPIDILGRFTSEPPGAKVILVSDGKKKKLGSAPAEAKLDPRKRYEVMFKKPGYVTVTKPVSITGQPDVNVAVVMERSGTAIARRDPDRGKKADTRPKKVKRGSDSLLDKKPDKKSDRGKVKPPKKDDTPKKVTGPPATLLIGSKPPCKIYIDGKDTGKRTPQRGIKVKPGKHKITLVNNEFKIKKTIRIDVKPGESKKIIKNFVKEMKK